MFTLLLAAALMQPPGAFPIKVLQSPDDAVSMALEMTDHIPKEDWPYTRFAWDQDGTQESMKIDSWTAQIISRSPGVWLPIPRAKDDFHIRMFNLKRYFPTDKDLAEGISAWEELGFDPAFSALITKDMLDFAGKNILAYISTPEEFIWREENRVIQHEGGIYVYPDDTGRKKELEAGEWTVTLKFKTELSVDSLRVKLKDVEVIRFNPKHIDPKKFRELQKRTQSIAPVVSSKYFITRARTQIQDDGVFKALFGGLYYRFRGIKKAKDVFGKDTKIKDIDLFFEKLGIGNAKQRVTVDKVFDDLRSDWRAIIMTSNITGKIRACEFFNTPASKRVPFGALTKDIKDKNIDVGDKQHRNVLVFRIAAQEGIFHGPNDQWMTVLFDGDGNLQNVVPPDVAADTTIPDPYTKNLQPEKSCACCHIGRGHDGWQPFKNEGKQLLSYLKVIGDFSNKNSAFSNDQIDRIAGLYSGDFDYNLQQSRNGMNNAVLRATGPWKQSKKADQADVAFLAVKQFEREYNEFNYTKIDARQALREIGLDVDPDHAVQVLVDLTPPDPNLRIGNEYLEDPNLGVLQAGLTLNRSDWALSYSYVAYRVKQNFFKKAKGAKK